MSTYRCRDVDIWLQCVAVCYSVLQYTATHCNTHTDVEMSTSDCSVLQCVAACCSTLQHTATHIQMSRCRHLTAVCCSVLQRVAVHCNTLQHTYRCRDVDIWLTEIRHLSLWFQGSESNCSGFWCKSRLQWDSTNSHQNVLEPDADKLQEILMQEKVIVILPSLTWPHCGSTLARDSRLMTHDSWLMTHMSPPCDWRLTSYVTHDSYGPTMNQLWPGAGRMFKTLWDQSKSQHLIPRDSNASFGSTVAVSPDHIWMLCWIWEYNPPISTTTCVHHNMYTPQHVSTTTLPIRPKKPQMASNSLKWHMSQGGFVSNFEWKNLAAVFFTHLARTLCMFFWNSEPDSRRQFSHCFWSAIFWFQESAFSYRKC